MRFVLILLTVHLSEILCTFDHCIKAKRRTPVVYARV
jgi:hypothetical protein